MTRPTQAKSACAAVRRDLLAAERPDAPATSASAHLERCAACRAWHAGLVRLEELVPETAATPGRMPESLREAIFRTPAAPDRPRKPNREAARQKLALALSLAASLACFAVAYWLWPAPTAVAPKEDRRADYSLRRERFLIKANGPVERLTRLADFAEALVAEAKAAGGDAVKTAALADHFDRLVTQDIDRTARAVSPGEGAILKATADRFSRMERDAGAVASLRRMAERAEMAARKLRAMG